jgi:hypothetical protein
MCGCKIVQGCAKRAFLLTMVIFLKKINIFFLLLDILMGDIKNNFLKIKKILF